VADTRPGTGLPTIFAVFLGLMVTAFIGVGVYTYYPSPEEQYGERIQDLNRRHQAIASAKAPDALTADDRARLQALTDERDALLDTSRAAGRAWGRRTSIILVAFATLTMAVSLVRAAQLPVISNGLLLGGVFTMLYGVGWIVATDTSTGRFAVITVALAITLGLGYLRFARGMAAVPAGGGGSGAGPVGELETRVRRLEERLDDAARAMQPRDRP
jgi:Flp pilus assembly protein TadB